MKTLRTMNLEEQLNLISFHSAIGTLKGYETKEIGKDEYNRPINEYLVHVEGKYYE